MTTILSKYSSAVTCNSRSSLGINVHMFSQLFSTLKNVFIKWNVSTSYPGSDKNLIKKGWGIYYKWHKELQPILCLLQQSNHEVVENIGVKYNPPRVAVCLHVSSFAGVKKKDWSIAHNTLKSVSLLSESFGKRYPSSFKATLEAI